MGVCVYNPANIQPVEFMDTFELENHRDAIILEQIEKHPDATQATLAQRLGVAVGTINWHLKRLVAKGYVKVQRAERRKLSYIITPEGLALRARLTFDFIQNQFRLYRHMRTRTSQAIDELKKSGYRAVRIEAEGDTVDVIRLTCLELGIEIVTEEDAPALKLEGFKIIIVPPQTPAKG